MLFKILLYTVFDHVESVIQDAWNSSRQLKILVVFALFGVLMMTELMPTFVALAAMALGIAAVGGLGVNGIINTVIVDGSTKLASAFVAVFFGAALGAIIEQTGIAEEIVKSAAELGGDNAIVFLILLYLAVAVISTSISGLGAFIMIATIVFPIMVSIGFQRKIAAGIVLLGYGNGVMFNPANWVFYADVTGIDLQQVLVWAIPTGVAALVAGLAYIGFQTHRGNIQATWATNADGATVTTDEIEEHFSRTASRRTRSSHRCCRCCWSSSAVRFSRHSSSESCTRR